MASKRLTTNDIRLRKGAERLTSVTVYDYLTARTIDGVVDLALVGDSLGMVFQGHETTLPVTVDHVAYHTAAVARGLQKTHLVADLPFLSYVSPEEALRSAGRLLVAGAQSVKLEGGGALADTVIRLVDAGVPVMGHLGLQPQSVHATGGYRLQGKTEASRQKILEDAVRLSNAGVFALVLEAIPADLAAEVTASVSVPTIGIGAGAGCDGQILVMTDLLGMDDTFLPRFAKRYADLAGTIRRAVGDYARDVRAGSFPSKEQSF